MKNKKEYVAFTLLCLFIINSILVVNGNYDVVDSAVHSFLIGFYSDTTTNIFRIFTTIGGLLSSILICGIAAGTFVVLKKYGKGIFLVICMLVSTLTNLLVKFMFQRPRPTEMVMVHETTTSYPSGHMMGATTLYGFLIYVVIKSNLSKSLKASLCTLLSMFIIMIGSSRIYLGAHFFSDIVGAIILSSFLLVIFSMFNDAKHLLNWKPKK